uniref:Uncharacterized protein n=1 Tax=Anguilla anguilla TaxID=7936 RepID=A0A0E9P680_ANGAN
MLGHISPSGESRWRGSGHDSVSGRVRERLGNVCQISERPVSLQSFSYKACS